MATDSYQKLQSVLDKELRDKSNVKILEAGCGSISKVRFKPDSYIVGIDVSSKQLERNTVIHEKLLGDIQHYDFNSEEFEVIMCWYVLEHLKKPDIALKNLSKALKKGGILILGVPNLFSLKGLITRFSPHWFHVFVYRHIYRKKDAGKDDNAPFKSFIKLSISKNSLIKFAAKNGYKIVHLETPDAIDDSWVGTELSDRSKLLYYCILTIRYFLKIISFGKISSSEIIFVARK